MTLSLILSFCLVTGWRPGQAVSEICSVCEGSETSSPFNQVNLTEAGRTNIAIQLFSSHILLKTPLLPWSSGNMLSFIQNAVYLIHQKSESETSLTYAPLFHMGAFVCSGGRSRDTVVFCWRIRWLIVLSTSEDGRSRKVFAILWC